MDHDIYDIAAHDLEIDVTEMLRDFTEITISEDTNILSAADYVDKVWGFADDLNNRVRAHVNAVHHGIYNVIDEQPTLPTGGPS